MTREAVTFAYEPCSSPDALRLIAGLQDVIAQLYGLSETEIEIPNEYNHARAAFLVARINSEAIGCGGMCPADQHTAKVKHVFVIEPARGHGIARQMMRLLESKARMMGYRRLVLDTGSKQIAAIRLYDAIGYTRISCADGTEWKLCFEKHLFEDEIT